MAVEHKIMSIALCFVILHYPDFVKNGPFSRDMSLKHQLELLNVEFLVGWVAVCSVYWTVCQFVFKTLSTIPKLKSKSGKVISFPIGLHVCQHLKKVCWPIGTSKGPHTKLIPFLLSLYVHIQNNNFLISDPS